MHIDYGGEGERERDRWREKVVYKRYALHLKKNRFDCYFEGLLYTERDKVLDHQRTVLRHPGGLRQDGPKHGQAPAWRHRLYCR